MQREGVCQRTNKRQAIGNRRDLREPLADRNPRDVRRDRPHLTLDPRRRIGLRVVRLVLWRRTVLVDQDTGFRLAESGHVRRLGSLGSPVFQYVAQPDPEGTETADMQQISTRQARAKRLRVPEQTDHSDISLTSILEDGLSAIRCDESIPCRAARTTKNPPTPRDPSHAGSSER